MDGSSLPAFFMDTRVIAAATSIGRGEDFQQARLLHQCVTDSAATVETIALITGGSVSLRMLVGDTLPKSVAIMPQRHDDNRTTLPHFGEKFRRFPRCRGFYCCRETRGRPRQASEFKSVENPTHNELTTERISDATARQEVHDAMVKLGRDIREAIGARQRHLRRIRSTLLVKRDSSAESDSGEQSGENALDGPESLPKVSGRSKETSEPPKDGIGVGTRARRQKAER